MWVERRGSFSMILGGESTGQNVQSVTKVRISREPVNAAHIVNRWFMLGIEQVFGRGKEVARKVNTDLSPRTQVPDKYFLVGYLFTLFFFL